MLLVCTCGEREIAQHAAVVQIVSHDLAFDGLLLAVARTSAYGDRYGHLLEWKGQHFVEVENPEMAHARFTRTHQQSACIEIDGHLLIVLLFLVQEEGIAGIAVCFVRSGHKLHARERPVVAVFAAVVDRGIAVEPNVSLSV